MLDKYDFMNDRELKDLLIDTYYAVFGLEPRRKDITIIAFAEDYSEIYFHIGWARYHFFKTGVGVEEQRYIHYLGLVSEMDDDELNEFEVEF